ncbi:hypothetical protein KJ761_01195 [Patescibacteria group bacterium]|nr:hypothetical protein [Patescibacteria group bacterium]
MKKKKYKLFVVRVREKCNGNKGNIKKSIHAECDFANDKEALERFWHIIQKDLVGRFDRIFCSVLQSGVRIGMFSFPEKRV